MENETLNNFTMSGEKFQQTLDILTDSQTELAMLIMMLFVTPAISVIGIVGNICSILVITKQNWRKCSNILLLGLAISDMTYLIGFSNIPKIIYALFGKQTFPYPYLSSQILFICSQISLLIDFSSGFVSLTLPMLITIERLITVFFPLRVSRIITTRRTFIAVSSVFVVWYGNFTYAVFWFELSDPYKLPNNRTVFVIVRSALFEHDKPAVIVIENAWAYLSTCVPAIFTFIGCIVIGIKIKMASMKRSQMTGRTDKDSMNRTTKTLLAVCGVYIVTCAIATLPLIIPQYVSYSISDDTTSNICLVTYQVMSTVLCVNSSCNFVIYTVCNKNFRDGYKALFCKSGKDDLVFSKII